MNPILPSPAALLAAAIVLTGIASPRAQAADSGGVNYGVLREFKVGGTGSWDYMIIDSEHKRLWVPRSTHTMVVDAQTGKLTADIPGSKKSHGVALVPKLSRAFISDGDAGDVQVVDTNSFEVLGTVKAADDADGIIYDPSSDKVLVVSGDGACVIPISPDIDPKSGKAGDPIDLGGKPEYLAADGQGKVFICLTDKSLVAVVDTKEMKVVNKWPTAPGGFPVSMGLDKEHHRLVIGCRNPAKMVIMSADDGSIVSSVSVGEGADASQYDAEKGLAFTSTRDGKLTIAKESSPGHFEVAQVVKTLSWAGTCGLDQETHLLYLPTAKFSSPQTVKAHAEGIPDSFEILVVGPKE